jgi:indole-3-acetate monooxygenase
LAAGTTAIPEGSRFERALRDMYIGTQHAFITEKVSIDVAQIWLGIIEDQFGL